MLSSPANRGTEEVGPGGGRARTRASRRSSRPRRSGRCGLMGGRSLSWWRGSGVSRATVYRRNGHPMSATARVAGEQLAFELPFRAAVPPGLPNARVVAEQRLRQLDASEPGPVGHRLRRSGPTWSRSRSVTPRRLDESARITRWWGRRTPHRSTASTCVDDRSSSAPPARDWNELPPPVVNRSGLRFMSRFGSPSTAGGNETSAVDSLGNGRVCLCRFATRPLS